MADLIKISDSTNTTSSVVAASCTAVKSAYDLANGKAPKAHASTATTYGIGTGSNYGHVKLSDSTSSTSAASAGIAASPKAVKAAYDLANTAKTTADSKQDKLGFTPVQQGGGAGQANNKVYIGWSGTGLKLQVDSTDLGTFVRTVNGVAANSAGNVSIDSGLKLVFSEINVGYKATVTKTITGLTVNKPIFIYLENRTSDSNKPSFSATATSGCYFTGTIITATANNIALGAVVVSATSVTLSLSGASSSNQLTGSICVYQ